MMNAGWLLTAAALVSTLTASPTVVGRSNSIRDRAGSTDIIRASASGAALNSNLTSGGGADDTSVLQRILNRAENGRSVHLIIDGPALITGLELYSNTTVECTAGGGLYLRENANRAILRNKHR